MSNVRRLRGVVLAVISYGCGAARAPVRATGPEKPFTLSSFGATPGIQVRLDGSIAVHDGWVYITVPTGAVRTYQLDRQDYWDLRVRAAVAACTGRQSDIVSEGRAARLAPLLGLSVDSARLDATPRVFRDTLKIEVGIPPRTQLARSWVALIFEWPFENVMATYTMHTNVPLDPSYGPWTGRAATLENDRCRG